MGSVSVEEMAKWKKSVPELLAFWETLCHPKEKTIEIERDAEEVGMDTKEKEAFVDLVVELTRTEELAAAGRTHMQKITDVYTNQIDRNKKVLEQAKLLMN